MKLRKIATFARVCLLLVVIAILLLGCARSSSIPERPQSAWITDNLIKNVFAEVSPDHFTIEIRDASNVQESFTFEQPVYLPKVAKDGQRLFYIQLSKEGYFSQVKMMELDRHKESQPVIVTPDQYGDVYSYDINSNGSKVTFLALSDSANEAKLYIAEQNVDEAKWRIKPLAGLKSYAQISLSDGGKTLAFALGGKLYVFTGSDFSEQQVLQMPYGIYDVYAVDGGVYYVSWANRYYQIFYYDPTGGKSKQITSDRTHKFSPIALLDDSLLYIDVGSRIDYYTLADYIILQGRKGETNNLYYSNECGRLAWGEVYLLEWLLVLYEVFEDGFYLRTFLAHVDAILQNTDANRGVEDWQGLSEVKWSSTRYSLDKKSKYRWVVHSGMIGLPIAKFVTIAQRNDVLEGYYEKLKSILSILEELIKAHEVEWVDHSEDKLNITLPGEGYYIIPSGSPTRFDGVNLPLNQQNRFGTLLLEMYKLTGKEDYLEKAIKLGRILKSQLEWDEEKGAYHWPYWWGIAFEGWSETDAISTNTPEYEGYRGAASPGYATMDLEFALALYKAGYVFGEEDVERFVSTYRYRSQKGRFWDQGASLLSLYALLSLYDRTLLSELDLEKDFRKWDPSARYSLLEKTGRSTQRWNIVQLGSDGVSRRLAEDIIEFVPLGDNAILVTTRIKDGCFVRRIIEIHEQ